MIYFYVIVETLNVYYPETPSPWENTSNIQDDLEVSEQLLDKHNKESSKDRTNCPEEISKDRTSKVESSKEGTDVIADTLEERTMKEKSKHQGTCYSFFPKKDAGASSYSMSFTAIPGDLPGSLELDTGHVNESVNSWREGLDGDWSE